MAGEYITTGLKTDPQELLLAMVKDYQQRVPNWAADTSDPLYVNLAIQAYRHAVLLDVASQVLDAVFRFQGQSLFGVNPDSASTATADSTWLMRDNAGYTIDAGTRVDIGTGPDARRFYVAESVVVPGGSTTTQPGEVPLIAEEPGAAGTGLTGPVLMTERLDEVVSISLVGETIGGSDDEGQTAYMDRLARRRRRLVEAVVTIDNLADAALDIPGVGKALAFDNYIPAIGAAPEQFDVPGAATVAIVATDGGDPPSEVAAQVQAIAAADSRLDDVAIYTMNATRTAVGVTYAATAERGRDAVAVKAAADQAISDYLNPLRWGMRFVDGVLTWAETKVVRFGELYAVLNAVDGLDTVEWVQITGAPRDTDLAIPGPAALTTAGTIAGTVASP